MGGFTKDYRHNPGEGILRCSADEIGNILKGYRPDGRLRLYEAIFDRVNEDVRTRLEAMFPDLADKNIAYVCHR